MDLPSHFPGFFSKAIELSTENTQSIAHCSEMRSGWIKGYESKTLTKMQQDVPASTIEPCFRENAEINIMELTS
jgi:hypothetical protein